MKTLFSNGSLAKGAAWLGALLLAGSQQNAFGKYNALVASIAAVLVGLGVHNASNTSKPAA